VADSREISSVSDLIRAVPDIDHAHVRRWFRGHKRKGWRLVPRVYRGHFATKSEEERLKTERFMMSDFRILSSSIRRGSETDEELYFLQQHYRMPTRLLDWTNNPLAAMFFAVEEEEKEEDGELFMMDAWKFEPNAGRNAYGRDFLGIADAGHPVFRKALHRISQWSKDQFPDFIVPVRPHNFDMRINLQRSFFTFHVPRQPEITEAINPSLTGFNIMKNSKARIRKELDMLGIDAFRIYGDLENLAVTLCKTYDV
jgi:hypothetical protein